MRRRRRVSRRGACCPTPLRVSLHYSKRLILPTPSLLSSLPFRSSAKILLANAAILRKGVKASKAANLAATAAAAAAPAPTPAGVKKPKKTVAAPAPPPAAESDESDDEETDEEEEEDDVTAVATPGGGKRKRVIKNKGPKDPDFPKRPLSAFLLFTSEKRSSLKAAGRATTVGTVEAKEMWLSLDSSAKQVRETD